MTATDPQDHITHLNGRMVDEAGYWRYTDQPGLEPPTEVEAFFRLSPHAEVVLDLEHPPRPVMFMASKPGLPGRSHVVVARDMGDLLWPAYIARLRATAAAEARAYVTKLTDPLRKALGDARFETARRRRALLAAGILTEPAEEPDEPADERVEVPW